jgi:hypothetical protein
VVKRGLLAKCLFDIGQAGATADTK